MNLEDVLTGHSHVAPVESAPVITIFVRHAADCKYAGDEFCKRCNCKKHFRWTFRGTQIRRAAGTRDWAEADRKKRILEDNLAGKAPAKETSQQTIRAAKDTFIQSREIKRVSLDAVRKYKLELSRFADFCEKRGVFTFAGITLPLLIKYQATWPEFYESTYTQAFVQKRLRVFLRWCREAGWIERVPKMDPVQIDEPPTMPLTEDEYAELLKAVPLEFQNGTAARIRAVIQLMRWSGLAVRDASTLRRADLIKHSKEAWHIRTERQKTGVHVRVPIPEAIAEEVLAAYKGGDHLFYDAKTATETSVAGKHSQAISNCFTRAGIKSDGHMISHRLRDTFAIDLLTKGVPLEDVSKLLGHNSIVTTEKHYAKWVKGRQDRLTNIVTATWEKK